MLKRPEAAAALKDFVVAVLYTDKHTQYRATMNKRFKSVALPLYVVVGPDGRERSRLAGQISLDQFLGFLKKGLDDTSRAPSSFDEARAESARTGKPVLVEFCDVTSLVSLHMRRQVLESAQVRAVLKGFVHYEAGIDHGPQKGPNRALMRDRFKLGSTPSYVILDPEGTKRAVHQGRTDEAGFLDFLAK